MASEEVRGSFCRYDSCVITDQLATGAGALERELLPGSGLVWRKHPAGGKLKKLCYGSGQGGGSETVSFWKLLLDQIKV